ECTCLFFFSSRRRHTRFSRDWSSDVCSSDLEEEIKRTERQLWQKIRTKTLQGRRTGVGITAEGDMIAALGLRYGTEEATEFSTRSEERRVGKEGRARHVRSE